MISLSTHCVSFGNLQLLAKMNAYAEMLG